MSVKCRTNRKTLTFDKWYRGLDYSKQPQFADLTGPNGYKYRVVYSNDPGLWRLSDFVVSSTFSGCVHLIPTIN